MDKLKVVVTDWEYSDLQYEQEILRDDRIEFVAAQCRTEDEVIEICRDADGIINQYAPLSRKVIESLEKCKVITRYGVGVNTIDLEAATEQNICVANVPDYCVDEVSDHAFALVLSWARKIPLTNQNVKNGVWDFKLARPVYRLRGRVLGLVGFGRIPQALATKAQALGLQVIVYDPYIQQDALSDKQISLVSLDELCQRSDFISVHAPLTDETRGMIGQQQFARMKRDAIIINTSRGPVIAEEALVQALKSGLIAGACLDVVENEPIDENSPLLGMDNVILTPHIAWYSEESQVELRSKAAMGVADVLVHGEYPRYLVNKKVKDKVNLRANQADRYQ